ncbi:ABC transporter permease [Spongiimicrobium salis]|uniref:ABC transporter permease n=1 Tax=Spongiimicrobium salis TaxID=1667022 RepID=UPI00374D410A
MFGLYVKIAVRYLLKNRLYSFINITGLAIGIASFVLIMLYVNYEHSYDTFEGSEKVYRAYLDYKEGDSFVPGDTQTSNRSGPSIKNIFPEVEEQVRFFWLDQVVFVHENKLVEAHKGAMADASYFNVFSYPLLKGDPKTALEDPNTVVLSQSVAQKIFGSENPIGKSIKMLWSGTELPLRITGVRDDIPGNTHFENTFLVSFNTYKTWSVFKGQARELNWNLNMYYTYLKVAENTNFEALQQKITNHNLGNEDADTERHNIEPIQDIHLYSNKPYEIAANGSITRVKFLSAIAFIILLLSWLNYINLSTTKSLERAKEIGIRKVSGAKKTQLILQSVVESISLNAVSLLLAFGLILLVMPLYNTLTGKALSFQFIDVTGLFLTLGIVLLGMILAGLYPAFLLSGYEPSKALKGKIQTSPTGLGIRKGLVALQFLATIVLLIGTLTVGKQINFMDTQSSGVALDQVISVQGEILSQKPDSLLKKDYAALEIELGKYPFIENISGAQTYPGDGYDSLGSFVGITYPDGTEEEKINYYNYKANPEYFDVVGINFVAGNTFTPTASGNSNQIVINEKLARLMGYSNMEDTLGQSLKFWGETWIISGVIENYHHFGLKNSIQPMIVLHSNTKYNLLVKLHDETMAYGDITQAIAQIRDTWNTVFPESTFNHTFLDQKFEAQYREDKAFGDAFQTFTILAIIIASLGLFGLTSYTCIQRKKEIGIRKVNGATIGQILQLLNQDFIKLIGFAFLLSIPTAWYAMSKWLEGFAYKTSLSWWIFALAGAVALVIALVTVSWQSFKAAISNPVDALRDE